MSPRIENEASLRENERVGVAQRKNKIVGSKVSSIKSRTEPISRSEENGQWINRRPLSATSAALSRLKVQLRSGKKGWRTPHSRSSRDVSDQDASTGDLNVDDPKQKRDDGKITRSAIFDDETKSDVFDTKMSTPPPKDEQECSSPRSVWASMLMPSTLDRDRDRDRKRVTGETETRDPFELLPRLDQAASDQIEYLIVACKAAEAYASTQAAKIIRVRDGQHMVNQLRDVASDLHRQQDKIRAVYDAREVWRSADRLEDTLRKVLELMGDVEATVLMFGKKKGFGNRMSALVHDIGTHANALLAATSLAIADRPNALYRVDTGGGVLPAPQREAIVRMCLEGDKFFFGRGEKLDLKKAVKAYSWAAERGGVEAMVALASIHGSGTHVEADKEKCRFWLESAVEKGYPPAMNDLAVVLLDEADRLEEACPELKLRRLPSESLAPSVTDGDDQLLRGTHEGHLGSSGRRRSKDAQEDEFQEVREGGDGGNVTGLTPKRDRLFEQIMAKRKRSMRLLQEAAKTGHTDAMTNLGNMLEAMGYFDDARSWYSVAAGPSSSANNPRAQNYLGTLYFEGKGVAKDMDEAVKWFRKSAQQKNAQAYKNLGVCYQAGLGVSKDNLRAVELFRQAVERGRHMVPHSSTFHRRTSVSATNNLAHALARDALHALAAAARQAPPCICNTGLNFEKPSRGSMKSGDASSEVSRQISRESIAQLRKAIDLFRRAADGGICDASFQLGRLYQQGLGIPRDPVAAFENFLAAADSPTGHPAAATCVGDLLYTGTGCLRDYGEALRYYLRAANAGEPASANAMGLMYELGRGVSRDLEAAVEWYIRAANLGSADGAFNGALLLERGDPVSAIASAAGLPVTPQDYPVGAPLSPPLKFSPESSGLSPLTKVEKGYVTATEFPRPASDVIIQQQQNTSDDENAGMQSRHRHHIPRLRGVETTGEGDSDGGDQNRDEREAQSIGRRARTNGEDEHRDQASPGDGRVSGRRQRASGRDQSRSHLVWKQGNRSLALRMFERSAALGHPEAAREAHRLTLRKSTDRADRMEMQPHLGSSSGISDAAGAFFSPKRSQELGWTRLTSCYV